MKPSVQSNIKAVIFDLDGTLVDAYRAVWMSLNGAFKKNNCPAISFLTVKRSVGWGETSLVKKFVPLHQIDQILQDYRASHRKDLHQGTKFLPGAKTLLRDLKKNGYKLAIASNRPTEFCELILQILQVRDHFDIVLCADKAKRPKPAGDMLTQILKELSLKSHQVLYVGDMVIDVQTGRNANVRTIAVTTGSSKKSEITKEKPYRIINNILRLKSFI